MPLLLDQIKLTHPNLYQAFSLLADGEQHLRGIMELDRYWQLLKQPVRKVILTGDKLPSQICST